MNTLQVYAAVFVIGFAMSLALQPDVLFALAHDEDKHGDNIKFHTRAAHAALSGLGVLVVAIVADYFLKRVPMTMVSGGGAANFPVAG